MEIALELMHFEMRFRKLYSGRGSMLKLLQLSKLVVFLGRVFASMSVILHSLVIV